MASWQSNNLVPERSLRSLHCHSCLLSLILFLLFSPQAVYGDTLDVEGGAIIKNERTDFARTSAIESGLREAVSMVAGSYVEGGTLVENGRLIQEKITTLSSGFVEKYEVLSEHREGKEYLVSLRVTVKHRSVANALEGLGVLLGRKDYPRVFLMTGKDNETNSLIKAQVTGILKEKGFFLTSAGQHSDIRLTIDGEFREGEFSYKNHPIKFSEIIVNMTAHNASTHEVLSSVSSSGKRPGVNQLEIKLDLVRSAALEASEKVIHEVVAVWQKGIEGETKLICFFKGLTGGYDDFVDVREFIVANGPRVNKVILRDFSGDTGVMEIVIGVSPQDFFQELSTLEYSGRMFVLEELKQESAVVNLVRR